MFFPFSWIPEILPLESNPIDCFFQGELILRELWVNNVAQVFHGKYMYKQLWFCLRFKGVVAACGVSVLCSLMRVYYFTEICG